MGPFETHKGRIRVGFLLSNFRPGGAETQYWNLIRALDRSMFDPHLIQLSHGDAIPIEHADLDLPVVTIRRRHKADLGSIWALVRYVRQHGLHVLQGLLFLDNQYARIAGRLCRIPVVTSVRGEIAPILGPRKTWLEFRLQRLSDRIVVNSQWLHDYLVDRGSVAKKIEVIYNGISSDRYVPRRDRRAVRADFGLPVNARLVGIVARLHPMKDHVTFIKAIAEMRRRGLDVDAVVVGEGSERRALESLTIDFGLDGHVHFLGSIADDIGDVYGMLDVLLLTSQWGESFPNVILEAMSAGLPVVASKIAAVPEIVEDGKSGFLVQSRDYVGFAERAIEVLVNPDLAQRFRDSGQYTVQRFSVGRMVEKFEALYMGLADNGALLTESRELR